MLLYVLLPAFSILRSDASIDGKSLIFFKKICKAGPLAFADQPNLHIFSSIKDLLNLRKPEASSPLRHRLEQERP